MIAAAMMIPKINANLSQGAYCRIFISSFIMSPPFFQL